MTSVLLQPGATMVDGVGLTNLVDHSSVVRAGYSAEVLYVANKYGTNRTAIERAWAAGLPVMLNYEGLANDAKNGYPAGERAAHRAITAARALGFDGDCPLPFSAADEHFADIAGAGLDYHRALVDVLTPIGWVGGAYGFKEMLELLARQDWWPDDWPLWHWGGDGKTLYPWASVKQGPGGSYFNATIGIQVDHNVLLKPMKFWSGYGPDPLDPAEDDMTPEQEAKLDALLALDTAIWNVLTQPVEGLPNDKGMQWNLLLMKDHVVDKDHLVNRIVAALPPDQGGLTEAEAVAAVAEKLSS